jgi:hypothetical protein
MRRNRYKLQDSLCRRDGRIGHSNFRCLSAVERFARMIVQAVQVSGVRAAR